MPPKQSRDGGMDGEAMSEMNKAGAPLRSQGKNSGLGYSHSYCLFCRTGQEAKVLVALGENEHMRALFPQRMKTERRKGKWVPVQRPMLPGYIFLYVQEVKAHECAQGSAMVLTHRLPNVLQVLRYGDGTSVLRGRDQVFADWLWTQDGIIGISKAIRLGERVQIVDGPLKDLGGTIKSLDAHKRVAKIELDIVGSTQLLRLSFDYIDTK